MEESAQVWRLKLIPRTQPETKPVEQPEEKPICKSVPSCRKCRYVKSKTCGSQEEHLKCKKPPPIPEPSILSIKASVSANCYACCCNLKEIFKEVFKAIGGDPKNRVCDILCQMSDLLLAIANDCILFLRKAFLCFLDTITSNC